MTDDAKLSREAIELSVAQLPDQPFAFAPMDEVGDPSVVAEEAVSESLGTMEKIEEIVEDDTDEIGVIPDLPNEPKSQIAPAAASLPVLTDTVGTATHLLVTEAPAPRNMEDIPVLKQDAPPKAPTQNEVDADMLAEIEGFMAELEADGTIAPEPPKATSQASQFTAAMSVPIVEEEPHVPATEDDFLVEPEVVVAAVVAAPAPQPEPVAAAVVESVAAAPIAAAPVPETVVVPAPVPAAAPEHMIAAAPAPDTHIEQEPAEAVHVEAELLPPVALAPSAQNAPRESVQATPFPSNDTQAYSLNIPFELHAQLSKKIDQLVVEAATSITNELQTQLSERVELLLQQAVESTLPALIDNMVQNLRNEVRGRIRQQLPLIVNDVLGKTRLSDGGGR